MSQNIKTMKKLTYYMSYLAIFIFMSCTAQSEKNNRQVKEFTGITAIEISTVSGSCAIKKTDAQIVKVEVEYNYKPAESFEPVFIQEENKLILQEKMLGSNSGNSDWTIYVPEQLDITFSSASGNMTIAGITGEMIIGTASGSIDATGIKLTGESKYSSASGNVSIILNESPKFNISVSSASGNATLNFNGNPMAGNIEMRVRYNIGEIICPLKFENEREEFDGNQKYIIKSLTLGTESPLIRIHSASGKAILKK